MKTKPVQLAELLALVVVAVVLSATSSAQAQNLSTPDSFVEQLGGLNVGESVAGPTILPGLGPIVPQLGPIVSGRITGQIELDSSDLTLTPAEAANEWDFRWGVLEIGTGFLANGGSDFFPSNVANEGITGISVNDGPGSYFLAFEVDLESQNLSLDPGNDYILFVAVGNNNFMGTFSSLGFLGVGAQNDVFAVATDDQPFQFGATGTITFGAIATQLVTSRIIPITPEPTSAGLFLVGAAIALRRRRPLR